MSLKTIDFDYYLPNECIAQAPARPRESAKLMIVDKTTGAITHDIVENLPQYFSSTDVIVVNNTKVFQARLQTTITKNNNKKNVELFLVRPVEEHLWLCIGKPGKLFTQDMILSIAPDFSGQVRKKHDNGTFLVQFDLLPNQVMNQANTYGSVPLPPYIKTITQLEDYQTSYAKTEGSVAAPTAGFHMTEGIRNKMRVTGVTFVEITLHVGLGTFMPVKTDTVEQHTMHAEWVEISQEASQTIHKAKQQGKRIIAIGTTTTRALEGTNAQPFTGDVNIFITPGFEFKIIDGLLTNFHLPKSTLLMLVSAIAGRDHILHAYKEAVNNNYRFFSFGDGMLIV